MNADGFVGFHTQLCALRQRPRPIQLEAYDISVLQQMAAKVGVPGFTTMTKQQLIDAIFRVEFQGDLRTKSSRSAPKTREGNKQPKGDPRAPFRPPKPAAAPAGLGEQQEPANVVELDDDDFA